MATQSPPTSFKSVGASYDDSTKKVVVLLGLLVPGELNDDTLAATVYLTTSKGNYKGSITRIAMLDLIDAYALENPGLNLKEIKLDAIIVDCAAPDVIGFSIIEDCGIYNNVLDENLVEYTGNYDGSILVLAAPSMPKVSLVNKPVIVGGSNYPLVSVQSGLALNIEFGDNNGGADLVKYSVICTVRTSTTASVFQIMNQDIAGSDITAGFSTFTFPASNGLVTGLTNISNASKVFIQVFVDNGAKDSDLSESISFSVNQQYDSPTLICAEQAPVSDDGITVSLNVKSAVTAGYVYILTKSGSTYTQVLPIPISSATGLATTGYDFSIVVPAAFTVYSYYAAVGSLPAYSQSNQNTSQPSAVANALSGIQTLTSVATVTDSPLSSTKDSFDVAVSGTVPSLGAQSMVVTLYQNAKQVGQKIVNVVGAYPTTNFLLNRNTIIDTDSFTATAQFLTLLSATQLQYISYDYSYAGNNFYQYGATPTSEPVVVRPSGSSSVMPTISNLNLATVYLDGVLSLAASWIIGNVDQETYPFENVEMELSETGIFGGASSILLFPQTVPASGNTNGASNIMQVASNQEYAILTQAASTSQSAAAVSLALSKYYYVRMRPVVSYAGAPAEAEYVYGEMVSAQFQTPDAQPILGPVISASTTLGTFDVATTQPPAIVAYGNANPQLNYQLQNFVYQLYNASGAAVANASQTVAYNAAFAQDAPLPTVSFSVPAYDVDYSVRCYANYKNGNSVVQSSISVTAEIDVPSTPAISGVSTIQTATTLTVTANVSSSATIVYVLVGSTAPVLQTMTQAAGTNNWSYKYTSLPANAPVNSDGEIIGYILASSSTGTVMLPFP